MFCVWHTTVNIGRQHWHKDNENQRNVLVINLDINTLKIEKIIRNRKIQYKDEVRFKLKINYWVLHQRADLWVVKIVGILFYNKKQFKIIEVWHFPKIEFYLSFYTNYW